MTTKVTIEVPSVAPYKVAVSTNTPPLRGNEILYLEPGQTYTAYIHDGFRIVGIEEVPA